MKKLKNVLSDEDLIHVLYCCRQCYNMLYPKWIQVVQSSVNQVIFHYYRLPPERRSGLRILELIGQYWTKEVRLFDSKFHYYEVLVKATDHLLQSLPVDRHLDPPVLLFEELSTYIKELDLKLQVKLHVAHWSANSFVIKKYVVHENPYTLDLYQHMLTVFCHQSLHSFPKKVEIINILSGNKAEIEIDEKGLQKSLDYLFLTKETIHQTTPSILV